jgi:hypothetical protein
LRCHGRLAPGPFKIAGIALALGGALLLSLRLSSGQESA